MLVDILEAPRLLHGNSLKECRSQDTTLAYYRRMATGEAWCPVLQAMVQTLERGHCLERWGLETQ
eukprot:2944188-Lingulodinium_polyedra.AAC.1